MSPKGKQAPSPGGPEPHAPIGISIAPKAEKDLGRLSPSTLTRVHKALMELSQEAPTLDIKPLKGLDPWWRLRVGSYRLLYRSLTHRELKTMGSLGSKGILLARCVPRKDLDTESRKLR